MEKIKNGITLYFHCKGCLEKGQHSNIAAGWTPKGVQVWCENCEENLVALDFKGNKVAYDINPESKERVQDN